MNELYSFSKLDLFNTCPRCYYYNYIKKIDRIPNVYGFLGGSFHDCLEKLQKGEISIEEAIDKFKEDCSTSELMGLDFPTEEAKKKYIKNLLLYLKSYKRLEGEFKTEEYFEVEIEGVKIRGYIDVYVIRGDEIYVIDYKTSAKFSKKELVKKENQCLLYAAYLQEKYPNKKIYCAFDMCKYTKNKRGTLKERAVEKDFTENAYVYVPFTEESKQKLKDFVRETYGKINSLDKQNKSKWKANNENYFYCNNICSARDICDKKKKYVKKKKKKKK